MAFYDGNYTTAKQDGPRRASYPFGNTEIPDVFPVQYDRNMLVLAASYSPAMATRTSITNLLSYSEQFDNAAWTKTNVTVTANNAASPNSGVVTADFVVETAVTDLHYVEHAATFANSPTTYSVFVKPNGRSWCVLLLSDSAAANFFAYFNVSTGVVGTTSGSPTTSIYSVGDGWYRCSITGTPAAGVGFVRVYNASADNSITYLGDITMGLHVWGAQVDTSSSVRAYIPTTTTTRTGSAPNIEINEALEGSDPFAFLVNESEPSIDRAVARFDRRYCRVPGDQVSYPGSLYINLPDVPDSLTISLPYYTVDGTTKKAIEGSTGGPNGATYLTAAGVRYIWAPTNRFFGIMKATQGVVTPATGGTFTLTYKTSTTAAIAYNDTIANIFTALNALADVTTDGITFNLGANSLATASQGYLQVGTLTAGKPLLAPVTMTSSLTPAAAATVGTLFLNSGGLSYCNIAIFGRATVTAHGWSAGTLMIGSAYAYHEATVTTEWVSVDANTIAFARLIGLMGDYIEIYMGQFARAYTPTTRLVATRQTDSFYLPAVTTGITTAADIPRAAGLQTPTTLIDGVLTTTGFQTHRTEGPKSWQGPILKLSTVDINVDDIA